MDTTVFDLVIKEIEKMSDKFDLDDKITEKLNEEASNSQRIYIKSGTIGRNSRDPLFPVSPRIQSGEAAAGIKRIKNAVEGWHLGVATLFTGNYSSGHAFLEQINLNAAIQKFLIMKAVEENSNPRRKKYKKLDEKLKNHCNSFDKTSILR